MAEIKQYSSKSNAKRALEKYGDAAASQWEDLLFPDEGKWAFRVSDVEKLLRPIEKPTTPVPPVPTTNSWLSLLGQTPTQIEAKKKAEPVTYHIEKEREERNGIKRPSLGCLCRQVWDLCDGVMEKLGRLPTGKEIHAACEGKGWNPNNITVEYYNWRKFNGFSKPRK